MRHLGSLIAGIVLAPLCWLLIAFGQVGSAGAFGAAGPDDTLRAHDFIKPLIFLAAAGLLLGLIASLRVSPLGPLVAGLAYAGSYVALLMAPRATVDALSYNIKIFHQTGTLTLPLITGLAPVIGVALLIAVFSASRWRRRPRPAGDPDRSGLEPITPAEPTPSPGFADFGTSSSPSWNSTSSWGNTGLDTTLSEEPLAPTRAASLASTSTSAATLDSDRPRADRPPADLGADSGAWPSGRDQEETTEAVPGKGRSPWDTPLRGTPSDQ